MPKIEMVNVSKSYGKGATVLSDIHFSVEQGEFFVLVGPSGCGKSTILRMIAGLEDISGGHLYIDNRPANYVLPKDRQVSMVFQNYALYPHMTVRENILFGINSKEKLTKQEKEARLKHALALVQLEPFAEKKPRALSGGQRQRVALARAIVSQAPICLMDEPLSNLDAKLRTEMRAEIRQLQRQLGLTMIYVTHDQVEAMTMGDRIMILNEGRIQQIGEPIEIYNDPANQFAASFIGSPQMNFTEAYVEEGKRFRIPDGPAVQPGFSFPKPTCILGIRPEHFKPNAKSGDAAIQATVKSAEQLGDKTIIWFAFGNTQWKAKWAGQWQLDPDDRITVYFSPEDVHFFDPDTREKAFNMEKGGVSV